MRRFLERVLTLLRLRRPNRDLAREIAAHLAMLQDTYEARGLSPEAARRAARLAFGSVDVVQEEHRDARSFRWIEDACQDAAHGLRLLRRSPVFTATAVLSLAIGIGANTAIFTVANTLLFRPPIGVADPSRLVIIGTARGDGGVNPLGYPAYLELARRSTSLESVYAEEMFPHVMGLVPPGTQTAEPVLGRSVTANFFATLGSTPARGRVFEDGEDGAAVLDYDYWQRRFNGDDRVIGQVLHVNGQPVSVVGVATPGFHGTGIQQSDLWLSLGHDASAAGSVVAGARVRPDTSLERAAAEVKAIGQAIYRELARSGDDPRRLDVLPFSLASGNRKVVLGFAAVLMTLVSLVLAVACANVAGIMLTRATARARELALRAALGAGRERLVRQLLTETLVLFLIGGLLGIGLAGVLIRLAALALPVLPRPIVLPLTLDWRVLLFALSLSIGTAVVFGVLPAFRGSRVDGSPALRDGTRSSSGRSRLRSGFVVGQIACSVLLVMLGALFVRALRHAGGADPGFDPGGIEIATIDVSVTGEPEAGTAAFWQTLIDRVKQMPAVDAASLARVPPGGFEGIGLGGVAPEGQAGSAELYAPAWNIVGTGYFATLRIPIAAGRDFAPGDAAGAPVVIISDAIARRFWPGEPAVGKLLRLAVFNARHRREEHRFATVIGVAGDIRSSSLIDGLAEPYVYLPLAQSDAVASLDMTGQMSVVMRRRGTTTLGPAVATVVRDIDRRIVLARVESLADSISLGLTPQRMLATISGVMGFIALGLAAMGIYGVTAYTVTLRRREFAIRLALGAPRTRVIRMVLGQGTALVLAGLSIGLAAALGIGQALSVLLYGLPATHPSTLFGTATLFVAIGVAASVVPAAQAAAGNWQRDLQEE